MLCFGTFYDTYAAVIARLLLLFSLSNVKSTFQKENDSKDEEKLLDEKSDSVKIK